METTKALPRPRRRRGEGSIAELRDQDGRITSYLAIIDLGVDAAGRRRRTKRRAKTRRDAQLKLAELRRQRDAGLTFGQERQPFSDFLTSWLEGRQQISSRTRDEYQGLICRHIAPTLGNRQLSRLTAEDIEALYVAKLREGLAPGTVRKLHAVLHAALAHAVRRRRLTFNPANLVEPPRPSESIARPLSGAEALRLLDAARGHRLEALFILALTLGLREGELLGLRWRDIDLDRASLRVVQTVDMRRSHDPFGPAKTERSRRSLPLIPLAIEALRAHRERQDAERAAALRWEEHDLVFCTRAGTPMAWNNFRRREFRPLLEKAGLPLIRPHDLRHSTGTLLMALGVPTAVIAALLGHSRPSTTTDIYQHADESLTRLAADALDLVFRPGMKTSSQKKIGRHLQNRAITPPHEVTQRLPRATGGRPLNEVRHELITSLMSNWRRKSDGDLADGFWDHALEEVKKIEGKKAPSTPDSLKQWWTDHQERCPKLRMGQVGGC